MTAWYNEIDPYCAQWLRNLIGAGLIPQGSVDERDIRDVPAADLAGFAQCHFFAGLGGWSRALELARWPGDRPVWTGSCPCQPFSAAGARKGFADERHLWPAWRRLIAERRPATVFGEQVGMAADWVRLVRSDLAALGYAVGAMPIEAASVGANHRRDRFWFVAHSSGPELRNEPRQRSGANRPSAPVSRDHGAAGTVADTDKYIGQQCWLGDASESARGWNASRSGECQDNVANADGQGRSIDQECDGEQDRSEQQAPQRDDIGGCRDNVANPHEPRLEIMLHGNAGQCEAVVGTSWWAVEPDVGRVAYGVPARVAKLRALGNAIVPQVAAEFIAAYMDVTVF